MRQEHRLRGLIVGWFAGDVPGAKSCNTGAAQDPAEDVARHDLDQYWYEIRYGQIKSPWPVNFQLT